jgi:hypothetical protein
MKMQRVLANELVTRGSVGGIIAGTVFLFVVMAVGVAQGRPLFGFLVLAASIPLGPAAFSGTLPLGTVIMVGLVVHVILSAIYGVGFAYLLALTGQVHVCTSFLMLYCSGLGFLLWVFNLLIIAPIFFPHFAARTEAVGQGLIAHTFFYGQVLGAYFAATRPGGREGGRG